MKKIKLWLRHNFNFSQRETNGFFLLIIITVLAIAAPLLFNPVAETYDLTQDQARLDSLVAQLDTLEVSAKARSFARNDINTETKVKLYRFDPNALTQAEWMQLGVSKFTATNIIKYREKAGGFRYKEQLSRIYGLSPELYQKLYPYINLPVSATASKTTGPAGASNIFKPEQRSYEKKIARLAAFDINTADTSQLKKIRGIGTKLAARIVKFRDKLGGFIQAGQLTEVYGLSPEVQDSLRKYTFIQAGFNPKQIAVNTATFEELRSHPYVGFNIAKVIMAYRTQHGPFQNVEQLKNIKLINDQLYQKLKPYLQI